VDAKTGTSTGADLDADDRLDEELFDDGRVADDRVRFAERVVLTDSEGGGGGTEISIVGAGTGLFCGVGNAAALGREAGGELVRFAEWGVDAEG
jgi:hypothetical protein